MSGSPTTLALALALLLPAAASGAEAAAKPPPAGTPPVSIAVLPRTLRLAEGGRARVRIVAPGDAPLVRASTGRIEGLREVAGGLWEADYVPPDTLDPQVVFVTAASPAGFAWAPLLLAGVREVEVRAKHRTLVAVEVEDQVYGPIPADATGKAVVRVDVPPGVRFATSRGARYDLDVVSRPFAHVAIDRAALDANEAGEVVVRAVAADARGAPLARAPLKLAASEGELSRATEVAPGVFEARWKVAPGKVRKATVTARLAGPPPVTATGTLERVAGPPRAVQVEVDPDRLVAGESDEVRVVGRVVDASGNATDAPARLVVSLGTGPAARLLPEAVVDWQPDGGAYSGRVQVPRQRAGRQELEVKVLAAGALVGTRTVALLPGPPTVVRVEPEEELFADGHRRVVRVSVLDQHGNRADPPAPPQLTAARGTLETPERAGVGLYRVGYSSPLAASDFRDQIRARFGPLQGDADFRVRARGGRIVLGPKVGFALGTGGLASPTGALELGFWTSQLGLVLEGRYFTFGRTEDARVPGTATTVRLDSDATFAGLDASLAWRRPLSFGVVWLGAGGGMVRAQSKVAAAGQALKGNGWAPSVHGSASWGLPFGPGIPFGELRLGWQADADTGPVRGALSSVTLNVGYRLDVL